MKISQNYSFVQNHFWNFSILQYKCSGMCKRLDFKKCKKSFQFPLKTTMVCFSSEQEKQIEANNLVTDFRCQFYFIQKQIAKRSEVCIKFNIAEILRKIFQYFPVIFVLLYRILVSGTLKRVQKKIANLILTSIIRNLNLWHKCNINLAGWEKISKKCSQVDPLEEIHNCSFVDRNYTTLKVKVLRKS